MRLAFFLLLFICFGIAVQAQDSTATVVEKNLRYDTDSEQQPVAFDTAKLEDLKSDPDFDYSEVEIQESWWTKFKRWLWNLWLRFWNWVFGGVEPGPFWAAVIRVLPYLIVLAALAFILWLFYKLNPGASLFGNKKTPEVFFTEEEEIIKSKNIQQLIDKAVLNHNYRLAVRYYYLLILKKLSDSEVITYEFDKTNTDYISEITSENLNERFSKATLLYDYIWYGSFAVTEEDYQKAQRTFVNLEHQIPKAVE